METATKDFTATITVNKTPEEVFNAINNVEAWWNPNVVGKTHQLGDEFEVRFGDLHYSKQKLVEMVPNQRVAWLVTQSHLSFLEDTDEWTGTKIIFDIAEQDGKTELRLTHIGLVPEAECYGACAPSWKKYLDYSLLSLIANGKGQPGFPPAGPLVVH